MKHHVWTHTEAGRRAHACGKRLKGTVGSSHSSHHVDFMVNHKTACATCRRVVAKAAGLGDDDGGWGWFLSLRKWWENNGSEWSRERHKGRKEKSA